MNRMLKDFSGRDLQREKIRIRDDFTCQWCGRLWNGTRRLDVHHIDGDKSKTLKYEKASKFDNMISLCHKCHLNLPHSIKEMSNGHSGKKLIFTDSKKEALLFKKIEEYFHFCVKKNKVGFEAKLLKYRMPRRGPDSKTVRERKNDPRTKKMWKYRQQGLTLQEVGKIFNVSRERVRQLILVFEKPN